MDKTLIAQGVANKLFATEKAIDAAIAEAAGLIVGLGEARTELRVSAIVADEATRKIGETIAQLTEARRAIVQAHGELATAKLQIGVRTKLIGIIDKPAPTTQTIDSDLRRAG